MSAPMPSPRRRAAIFGGSFDPVHLGHLEMARVACRVAGLGRLLFMPAAVSPFKQGTVADAAQRLEMLSIALSESGLSGVEVSDFELNRRAPSYSWETARHFREEEPDLEWCWILGTDQWEQIDRWSEPEILRETLHFLVFSREGQVVREWPGWRHTTIAFAHPASSTAIREDLDSHRDWLTPGVAGYCEREGLYQ